MSCKEGILKTNSKIMVDCSFVLALLFFCLVIAVFYIWQVREFFCLHKSTLQYFYCPLLCNLSLKHMRIVNESFHRAEPMSFSVIVTGH